jgi:hypothetical protein
MTSIGVAKLSADSKLEIRLIWGTDAESSPNPKHTLLEAPLAKKLGMFKWKRYFTVNRKEVSLDDQKAQKVRLSQQCEVEVKHLSDHRYEINIYGKGKHVRKITEKITHQDSLAIAGDAKNDSAWFILIREL